jgi:anthranilate phosphoribosyltransferase
MDGYDEVSLTGAFKLLSNSGEQILQPEDLGFETIHPDALKSGNTIASAAKIFYDVLDGKGTEAQNNAVIANAGLAIYCGKQLPSLKEGIAEAEESLRSGKAMEKFKSLVAPKSEFYMS